MAGGRKYLKYNSLRAPVPRGPCIGYTTFSLLPVVEELSMTTATIKDEARRLVERLPDDATWEDLQYQIYFRQAVEVGLKDSREGRVVPLEEARRLGLGTP
jgi:hypothetical protein